MQLTRHTDYGLRMLIVLARAGGGPVSLPTFAKQQRLSYNHIAKVAQRLVHGGFITSQRGRNGGVSLSRPSSEINIGEAVRSLEQGTRLADCEHCELRDNCRTSGVLAKALRQFMAVLDGATLAEVAADGPPAFPAWSEPEKP